MGSASPLSQLVQKQTTRDVEGTVFNCIPVGLPALLLSASAEI